MTIVNPLASAHLVVQSNATSSRPEERQLNLRLEQIVRATVVEGGLDKATLELMNQRVRIEAEQQLLTGQQLELKVLSLQPKLSFQILTQPGESRLATLLPLLNRSFDWHGLLQRLTDRAPSPPVNESPRLPASTAFRENAQREAIAQLARLLRPAADLPPEKLTELVVSLGQLRRSEPLFTVQNAAPLAAAFDRVLQTLTRRVEGLALPQQLRVMAQQVRQQPELMQNFADVERGRVEQLLQRIDRPQAELSTGQARQLATELRGLLVREPGVLPQKLTLLSQELGQLLISPPGKEFEFTPALLGQLKVLTTQLQIAHGEKAHWPAELQQVVGRVLGALQPLVADPECLVAGEKLGMLAQFFGLNLEVELLRGRTREALIGLKLALLGEQRQLPEAEEALHRIELYQVCRAKLGEQNLLFFPLPLAFLEEGFLLVDADEQHQGEGESEVRHMSLHLRLSELGSLRIDILNESSGLSLRVACEDRERAEFLQGLSGQLREQLRSVKLNGLSFTAGAESPARELIAKLVPRSTAMLDARV